MSDDKLTPLTLFLSAMGLSSVGGLAALLRSHRSLSVRTLVAAAIYSGITGLIIALLSYNYFGVTNPYFLLGVCGLAGVGGTTVLDFLVQVFKNGGVNITIRPEGAERDGKGEGP